MKFYPIADFTQALLVTNIMSVSIACDPHLRNLLLLFLLLVPLLLLLLQKVLHLHQLGRSLKVLKINYLQFIAIQEYCKKHGVPNKTVFRGKFHLLASSWSRLTSSFSTSSRVFVVAARLV